MTTHEFVKEYYPFAKQSEKKTGVSALAILAQCALETGWGKHIVGNMMFGIKAKNWNGKKQLITTTEYHNSQFYKYPEIISIEKISDNKYKYKVKDWFRAYSDPSESFNDYINLILSKKIYSKAAMVRTDPFRYTEEIAKAGYATDPSYVVKLHNIIRMIEKRVKELGL